MPCELSYFQYSTYGDKKFLFYRFSRCANSDTFTFSCFLQVRQGGQTLECSKAFEICDISDGRGNVANYKKLEFITGRALNICTKTGISGSRASKNPDFRVNL